MFLDADPVCISCGIPSTAPKTSFWSNSLLLGAVVGSDKHVLYSLAAFGIPSTAPKTSFWSNSLLFGAVVGSDKHVFYWLPWLPTEPGPEPGPARTRPEHAHPTRTGPGEPWSSYINISYHSIVSFIFIHIASFHMPSLHVVSFHLISQRIIWYRCISLRITLYCITFCGIIFDNLSLQCQLRSPGIPNFVAKSQLCIPILQIDNPLSTAPKLLVKSCKISMLIPTRNQRSPQIPNNFAKNHESSVQDLLSFNLSC